MKIEKTRIENFRSYQHETTIDLGDLNVFVGKNDSGKSTILEALDIFFNENKGVIKIEGSDLTKQSQNETDAIMKISVVFSELPESLTLDATYETNLSDEYLLTKEGHLEIIKKYSAIASPKEKIFIKAYHPTNPKCADLFLKNLPALKKMLTDDMSCEDQTKNAEIRKAIWMHFKDDLQLKEIEIELAKDDAKETWTKLKEHMPLYSLFQSDRKNNDDDSEVQDPMKLAVREILKDQNITESLNTVANDVKKKLDAVASKTLEKLNEMNPEIAESLNPVIPSAEKLKWYDVFRDVSIIDEDDIPINKRGSGVKRLVLLNFFRAEAERRKSENKNPSIIYAIEEPETSQHPDHQKKLIEAFIELSKSDNTQIFMTTHSPSIVKLLKFDHIKLIKNHPHKEVVNVEPKELPYPSLNEVNFLAFEVSSDEYHNELYGHIEEKNWLDEYKKGKPTRNYNRHPSDDSSRGKEIIFSAYIRHQIHHPENKKNERFKPQELQESIVEMRAFIQSKKEVE